MKRPQHLIGPSHPPLHKVALMRTVDLLRLAALVFTAVTCVVMGDTAGKLLTARGVDPVVVAWSRFALGALVLEGSVLVGQKLRDLDLPDGIRFGAMVRAEELITPRGGTEIKIGDRIVVFALSNAIEDVEHLFPASRQKN